MFFIDIGSVSKEAAVKVCSDVIFLLIVRTCGRTVGVVSHEEIRKGILWGTFLTGSGANGLGRRATTEGIKRDRTQWRLVCV